MRNNYYANVDGYTASYRFREFNTKQQNMLSAPPVLTYRNE